jgi:UDP-3-O-[3-hydroxymyristoyl] glucosamine N-acyltransferase
MSDVSVSLAKLAQHLNATIHNPLNSDLDSILIGRVAPLDEAKQGDVTFLNDKKYLPKLPECQASAVILTAELAQNYANLALVMKDPYVGFALAAQLLDPTPRPQYGIHPSAVIAPSAQVGVGANIGPNVVIEADAIIGEHVTLGPGTVIGVGAVLGSGCHIHANVTIYHGCVLGQNVAVLSGTVIGPDGFGYANDQGTWRKIPQTGKVVIGDNTEIGALCTIDRGSLADTEIAENVIIDDQVHIAHNCRIGTGSCLCGAVAMAGSVTIGKNVICAGTVAINGHINICDGVQITGNTMVTSDITEPGVYSSGMPHAPYNEWRRNSVRYKQLDTLAKRVKALENK